MMTIEQLEWMALAAYDNLDSEQIAAVDYGISVAAELCEAMANPFRKAMHRDQFDLVIREVEELVEMYAEVRSYTVNRQRRDMVANARGQNPLAVVPTIRRTELGGML